MTMVHCRACGKEIHETAPTCPHCGAPQLGDPTGASIKTQTVAGLWCGFLGGFGAHRFYLGKTVTGILYLLFFWTSIPGLIASIELLVIAFSDTQKWAKKYNGGRPTPPTHWAVKALALLIPIVVVVAVLAAIALPAYSDYTERARTAVQSTGASETEATAQVKDQGRSAQLPTSDVGSGATCDEGANDTPVLGSSYNNGVYLCRETIEIYWNDWWASRAGQDKLLVESEGKTSSFSGNLIFNCSTGASSWSNASDFGEPLATDKEIASVVPLQVVKKAMQYFCKG